MYSQYYGHGHPGEQAVSAKAKCARRQGMADVLAVPEPHDFLPSMASGSRESFYFEVDGNALASQQVSGQEFR